jgi:RNA polymerase-binding transcription factor DksA
MPAGLEEPRLCADCAMPIARADLQSNPQARFCRRCESERERRRARPSAAAG